MEGRKRGNYRVFLAHPGRPQSLFLNWDAPRPGLRAAFRDLRVRQALSHAINREEIRDALYHGIVFEPSGYGFSPLNAYYDSDHYMRYTEYRPDLSSQLLEEAGYRDNDGDGYRELHDGRRFELTIDYVGGKEESDVVQFVAEYWEAIGIKVHLNVGLGNVIYSRRLDGKFDVFQGLADGAEDIFTRLESWGIFNIQSPWWHRSASTEGPPWLHRATELIHEAMTLRDSEKLARNLAEVNRLHSVNIPVIAIGPLMKVWGASTRLGNVSGDVISSDAFRGWGRPVAHELLYFKDAGDPGEN
jgi:ABC-type transport system substrate-binding protein